MYLSWNEQIIFDFSDASINSLYNRGYVFTRVGRGVAHQTRSIRVNLAEFELSSENRRVLKKNQNITYHLSPIPYSSYDWGIGKMAKDFYETKFGEGIMSANKIKELLTDANKSNFNRVFIYSLNGTVVGYCIALETNNIIHYSYPFYYLSSISDQPSSNIGMAMMTNAVAFAKNRGKKYIYLGSAQRSTDTYKLQFSGLEWFDGKNWKQDTHELKSILV